MMITNSELELAKKIARAVAYNWKRVDEEDIYSHLVFWLYNNTKNLTRWETELKQQQLEENKLAEELNREPEVLKDYRLPYSLRNEANKYCAKWTKSTVVADISSVKNSKYSPEKLSNALPELFKLDLIELSMSLSGSDKAFEVATEIFDALYSLSKKDQQIISLRYKSDLSYASIAELLGIKENTANKRVERAVERLSAKLIEKEFYNPSTQIEY
jgi:RNA polymerase sigma factor (sigma-70 family)